MLRFVSTTATPPNFSNSASASTSATMASATTPAAGTAQTSERWLIALAGSPLATSTVSSARGTVEMGFMAARTRSTSPVLMPPAGGRRESIADLDPLDRLNPHQGAREARVQPAVPVDMAAEPGGQSIGQD